MMIQYFYLSRFIDRYLKGNSFFDKLLCLIGSCFFQVSLSIMCFTYSDQGWKSLMFYCYVITLVGVSLGMLISYVVAVVKVKKDAFRTVALVKHKGKYYAIIALKVLFNPFIRGFYASVLGFCVITFIYGMVTYVMLHICHGPRKVRIMCPIENPESRVISAYKRVGRLLKSAHRMR